MSKRKRSRARRPATETRSASAGSGPDSAESIPWLIAPLVWGLLLSRWFLPTEGTASGDTLWLTVLTLAAAAGVFWTMNRFAVPWHRMDQLDAAVWMFVGAHVLSALAVVLIGGDRRAATTMLWEWLAVGVTFSMNRLVLRHVSRQMLLQLLAVMVTALACYGVWQPLFWYPSTLDEYEDLVTEYEQLQDPAPGAPGDVSGLSPAARQKRLRELQEEFVAQGIPFSGRERQLFERRLRDSSEPLGFFALANTFAGLLAIGTVLTAGTVLRRFLRDRTVTADSDASRKEAGSPENEDGSSRKEDALPRNEESSSRKEDGPPGNKDSSSKKEDGPPGNEETSSRKEDGPPAGDDSSPGNAGRGGVAACVFWCVAFLVIVYCLFLTKSRTAWVGTLAGLGILAVIEVLRFRQSAGLRRIVLIVTATCLAVALLGGLAATTGALDVEVISEAPKSLQYRLEYWTGTWEVILEHPWLGTGPGNFRDHYLQHKLPSSSEEIADPHQFILDVTAKAGVVGFAALLWLLVVIARRTRRVLDATIRNGLEAAGEAPPDESASRHGGTPSIALLTGATLVISGEWLFQSSFNWHVLTVCLLGVVLNEVASRLSVRDVHSLIPLSAVAAALGTLLVHLLAAGGIAMPAIVQTLLVLAAIVAGGKAAALSRGADGWLWSSAASPQFARTGSAQAELDPSADTGALSRRAGRSTSAGLSQATPSDGQPEWRWLAVSLTSAAAAVGCTLTAFVPVIESRALLALANAEAVRGVKPARVVSDYRAAAEADPLSPRPLLRLSEFYFRKWQLTQEDDAFEKSLAAAEEALDRSPFTPQIRYQIGKLWLERARSPLTDDDSQAAENAQEWLRRALEAYPTDPLWNAEYAIALELAGRDDAAEEAARKAIALDQLNRAAGHVDRYLSNDLLDRLESVSGVADAGD